MSRVLWGLAVLLAFGCESKGIDSESHFLCARDSDCEQDGGACVAGRCRATGRAIVGTGGRSGATGSGGKSGTNGTGGIRKLDGSTGNAGAGGAAQPDGATNSGGTGGATQPDGATNSGGTGGATQPDGATNSGGASTVADASSGGTAGDASTDAALIAACNVTSTTLLARAGLSVDQIALDGGYVYFHDGGGISRVPRSGGSAVRLATFQSNAHPPEHAFVVDDSWITWWEPGTSADGSIVTNVNHMPKSGGPITLLAALPPAQRSLMYTSIGPGPNGSVFLWPGPGAITPPVVLQVRPDGSVHSFGDLGIFYNNSNTVVSDGTDVFGTGDNGVYIHVSNSFYDGFTSVTNANAAEDLLVDGPTLYIGSSDTSGYVRVWSAPKAGGAATTLFFEPAGGIYLGNMTMDADYLYVVERMTAKIVRMGKDGSNPIEILKGVQYEQYEQVAIDDHCIYWSVQGSLQGPNRTQSGVYVAPR